MIAPRLVRGALVALDPWNPIASVIIFQYNPSELSRTLTPPAVKENESPIGTLRLTGPPRETIALRMTINAADQLAVAEPAAVSLGIYPQLAALEMIMYPKSALVLANTALAALGTIEIQPPQAPLTLFVWGLKRVIPVRLDSYHVTETLHDPSLNPLGADVDLSLSVLSYADFTKDQAGYYMFLAHQVVKEAMAAIGTVSSLNSAGVKISFS